MKIRDKKVMTFGVFDVLHEGHGNFLRQAKREGDYLIAVVTRDTIVRELKHKIPIENESMRARKLRASGLADEVVLGDVHLGAYDVIKELKPDVIALGYDQDELRESIKAHSVRFPQSVIIKLMEPHRPEILHSSLLKSNVD